MSRNTSDASYEVGYGKPPRAGQFKKGQSGNPKGRPKGSGKWSQSVDETIFKEIHRLVPVKVDGELTRISVLQATIRALSVKAIKGEDAAQRMLLTNACNAAERQALKDPIENQYEPPTLADFYPHLAERLVPASNEKDE